MAAEPKFTTKQLVAIAGVMSALSGAGGAFTVAAQDAVQDQRLEQHERQLVELRIQVMEGTQAAIETRTTVRALENEMLEIRSDTKEIQRLLNQIIGANGARR